MLEDDVGRLAEDLLDRLAEAARLLEAGLLLLGRLVAAAHHPGELVAVDVADGAELLDQLALLLAGDDADGLGAGGAHSWVANTPSPPAAPQISTRWPAWSLHRSISIR